MPMQQCIAGLQTIVAIANNASTSGGGSASNAQSYTFISASARVPFVTQINRGWAAFSQCRVKGCDSTALAALVAEMNRSAGFFNGYGAPGYGIDKFGQMASAAAALLSCFNFSSQSGAPIVQNGVTVNWRNGMRFATNALVLAKRNDLQNAFSNLVAAILAAGYWSKADVANNPSGFTLVAAYGPDPTIQKSQIIYWAQMLLKLAGASSGIPVWNTKAPPGLFRATQQAAAQLAGG